MTSEQRRADVVLRGGTVVTVDDDRRVIPDGVVMIVGDRISAVGTREELGDVVATTTIDCTDTFVLPGLVDTHTHLFQSAAAGRGDGLPVVEWLQRSMWPYAATLDATAATALAALGAVRSLRAGTTAVLDHHYAPTSAEATLGVADSIDRVGLRGAVARGMLGDPVEQFPVPPPLRAYSTADEIAITSACMSDRGPNAMVSVWPGPGSVHAADPAVLVAAAELAAVHACRWHTHTNESRPAVDRFTALRGAPPVVWLHELGALGASTHAHGVHLTDDELALLADTAGLAHCPVSNAYLGSGVARIRSLIDGGTLVGLGTDGAAVGGRGVLECAKSMLHHQRIVAGDPTVMTAHESLAAATRNGADLLGLPAGRIEVGLLADLVVVELSSEATWPFEDPVVALVSLATERDVRDVVVGGRTVVRDRTCTRVDESDILAAARDLAPTHGSPNTIFGPSNPRS